MTSIRTPIVAALALVSIGANALVAGFERFAPQILAVKFEQVECVEENLGRTLPVPQ